MAIREGLLALLDEGPRHGYQLKTDFEAITGGVWPLNVGQVYNTLDRLERDGLVTANGEQARAAGGPQRTYRLTASGREELGSWWTATPPTNDPPPRDELVLKVLMAIAVGQEHALRVITRQRTALHGMLQQARRVNVAPGELVAVMGPSGCGKSTLLHLAGALEDPTAGRVLVDGRDLALLNIHERSELRRRDVGYVFQRLNLIPALTAVENVMLPLELDGVGRRQARERARAALETVGLEQQIDRYPDSFSGGQQQRIAIARAVVGT